MGSSVCWHIFGGGEELRESLNIPEQSGAGMRKSLAEARYNGS